MHLSLFLKVFKFVAWAIFFGRLSGIPLINYAYKKVCLKLFKVAEFKMQIWL